jgi:hypothetical protein
MQFFFSFANVYQIQIPVYAMDITGCSKYPLNRFKDFVMVRVCPPFRFRNMNLAHFI